MKKKPAPIPETPKTAAQASRVKKTKTDAKVAPAPARSATVGSAKRVRAPRPPLLDSALAAARKFLKPRAGAQAAPAAKPVAAAVPVARPAASRKKKLEVPPILLEGDAPSVSPVGGPGEKFSLGATPPAQSFSGGELPESYGTKKLFLTARDPHWLYAHWDLTRAQQIELNSQSSDGHLVLRIFTGKIQGHPAHEIHVHPESRHWFAHVEQAGNSYAAELGYYSLFGKWTRVAVSSGTVTPPDAASVESGAEFATIPFEFPFAKLMQIIEEAVRDNLPLALAIEELRRHGHPDLPRFTSSGLASVAPAPSGPSPPPGSGRTWTPEQEKALAKIINIDETRRVWMGSLEITELIRRRLEQNVTSPVTGFGTSSPGLASSPTSPFGGGGEAAAKGFWFNVNAELIIYGATEPKAKVTLGGHEIKLRSDGTFSFRFALPDGKYDLPAVAVSADGTDGRAAELKFSRETEYLGDVGATPPDPALQPPLPENL